LKHGVTTEIVFMEAAASKHQGSLATRERTMWHAGKQVAPGGAGHKRNSGDVAIMSKIRRLTAQNGRDKPDGVTAERIED
jgi:hypothetical protein